jgi:hypothetical protein
VDEPLLVEKKKFDLRLYVLIKGFDPIEAFLYEEGMARFCTENYKKPDKDNLKTSEKYVEPDCKDL